MVHTIDRQIPMQRQAVGQVAQDRSQCTQMRGIGAGMNVQVPHIVASRILDQICRRGQQRQQPRLPTIDVCDRPAR